MQSHMYYIRLCHIDYLLHILSCKIKHPLFYAMFCFGSVVQPPKVCNTPILETPTDVP